MNIRVIPVHKLCLEFCQFARVFTKVNGEMLLEFSLMDSSSKHIIV